ncbi:hypothetical protein JTB14_022549 [Gonioctena quinquepunctata]|nr:hypothetical protein JTB14_022549 [Gonioctena quinquepunctata]
MELTQKGEMVSRLQAKAGQIGKILNNLEKFNHLMKDDKKSSEKRLFSDRKQPVPRNIDKDKVAKKVETKNTDAGSSSNMETELREPITSDSTESFIKLDLDLNMEENKE